VIIILLLVLVFRRKGDTTAATAFHEVKRGDFTVTVVEGGTLTAVSEVSIRSEVEGTARIISIVPEGSYVKKGDLLVELDSAQAQDQVNLQQINYEKAKFAVEQAKAQLEIQQSATNSDYLAAALKLKFAKIDRDKYQQGQRLVDLVEASNKVVQVEAQLAVNLDTFINSTNLAAKGYETKQRADGDRLALLNTQNSLIVATNGTWMLEKFDQVKLLDKYESDVLQTEQELERVISQNRRKMAQFEADLQTQENTLVLSEQKLERDKKNLQATKIYAPQEGLVVYQISENRFSSESLVEGGAIVRNRQELIKLPDLSHMKVTIKVHESHVNMIHPGLQAYVVLDSTPDERFRGYVEKVAPLPDTQARWGNPNLKVYNTDIYLTDTLPNVKPGVSAKAEVVVTNIADTLSVPIQAVTTLKGKQVVYVVKGGSSEPRPIEVGMFNTKFIEITKGVNEGDRVLLSPPFDTQEREINGSVLTAEEKAKAATNGPPRRPVPAREPGLPGNGIGQPIVSAPEAERGAAPAVAGATGEGERGPSGRGGEGPRMRQAMLSQEEMLKQFDKNGDGQLDESERETLRTTLAARLGGDGKRPSREDMLKRFDKNGDGQLDDSEREAMRASFGGQGGPRAPGSGRRGGDEAGGQRDDTRRPSGNPPAAPLGESR
jgi:HlyD family secretion protein